MKKKSGKNQKYNLYKLTNTSLLKKLSQLKKKKTITLSLLKQKLCPVFFFIYFYLKNK